MRTKSKAAIGAFRGWLRSLTGRSGTPRGRQLAGDPGRAAAHGAGLPERLWSQAALLSSHGIAIVDPSSATLRAVNAAYAQLIGRTPEKLAGQSSNGVFPASERVALLVAEHSADLNGAATLETRQVHLDGSLIPVEVSVVSVREGNGPISYRIQTVTDLRARLKAEGELRFGEVPHTAVARFRQLADSAPVGILLMDADGGLSYANPCWLALTGLDFERARGEGWWDAIHPDDRERVSEAWERLMRDAPLDLEFRYCRDGGETRSVQSRAAALRDERGACVGFMCIDVDVTEQQQRRTALEGRQGRIRALAHRLEQLREEERGGIARRLHGTLRQELTTLRDGLESLRAQPGRAGQTPEALGDLAGLAGRCLEELRQVTFELEPPGIEELGLTDAMQRCADQCAAQSGLAIEVTDAGSLPELGRRGSLALYRTLQEALSNVVKHAHARHVEAHLWVQDGAVHLRVSDDGVGIGDRDRGKTGCFGLLAAAERLTQLGGALRVFGVSGRGTTLDASVPAGPGKERRASAAR